MSTMSATICHIACTAITILVLCEFTFVEAQKVVGKLTWQTSSVANHWPVINLFCGLSVQCFRYCVYTWSSNKKVLAVNNILKDATPSRFSVFSTRTLVSGTFFYGNILQIRNALKEDAGWYECNIDGIYVLKGSIEVTRFPYLPSLNYPECSIGPTTTLMAMNNGAITCIVGDSHPSVNLQLSLQRQDGSIEQLGNERVRKQVTLK